MCQVQIKAGAPKCTRGRVLCRLTAGLYLLFMMPPDRLLAGPLMLDSILHGIHV